MIVFYYTVLNLVDVKVYNGMKCCNKNKYRNYSTLCFKGFLETFQKYFKNSRSKDCQIYFALLSFLVFFSFNSFWTVARQAPLSLEFSRQVYWTELPFPPPGDPPHLRMELVSHALADRFFTTASPKILVLCYMKT